MCDTPHEIKYHLRVCEYENFNPLKFTNCIVAENFCGPKFLLIRNYETFSGKIFVVPTVSPLCMRSSTGHTQFMCNEVTLHHYSATDKAKVLLLDLWQFHLFLYSRNRSSYWRRRDHFKSGPWGPGSCMSSFFNIFEHVYLVGVTY